MTEDGFHVFLLFPIFFFFFIVSSCFCCYCCCFFQNIAFGVYLFQTKSLISGKEKAYLQGM